MMNAMKLLNSPLKIFWLGLACILAGFILPFLIVLGYITNSFGLSVFIYILQLVGMMLGVIAGAGLAIERRAKDKEPERLSSQEQDAAEDQSDTVEWMK